MKRNLHVIFIILVIICSCTNNDANNETNNKTNIAGQWKRINLSVDSTHVDYESIYQISYLSKEDPLFNAEIGMPGNIEYANYKAEMIVPSKGKSYQLVIYFNSQSNEFREKQADGDQWWHFSEGIIEFGNPDSATLDLEWYAFMPEWNRFKKIDNTKYNLIKMK